MVRVALCMQQLSIDLPVLTPRFNCASIPFFANTVTDVGQSQHFEMVFKAARSSNLLTEKTELRHVPFGLVQGEDGKKFKTRSGDTVRLKDLLDQAVSTAEEDMLLRLNSGAKDVTEGEKILELSAEDKAVARIVGIGAVKYADQSNYRFSYRKMLSLTGNTAPYMLYAFARIQGIQRKALAAVAGIEDSVASKEQQQSAALLQDLDASSFDLTTKEEQALAKQLMRLDEVLEEVSRDLYPNKLCEYLFELSQRFNQFYERCPVLAAETPQLRKSRAALCSLTADTLKLSLDLLGIRTVKKL
jgi:arginyl-tRNA synthetase